MYTRGQLQLNTAPRRYRINPATFQLRLRTEDFAASVRNRTRYLDPPGLALVLCDACCSFMAYQPDSSSIRSRGSIVCVPYRAVQCRCGPVTLPVDPTRPIVCPRVTVSPTETSGSLR